MYTIDKTDGEEIHLLALKCLNLISNVDNIYILNFESQAEDFRPSSQMMKFSLNRFFGLPYTLKPLTFVWPYNFS